jgi:hypothetical protein
MVVDYDLMHALVLVCADIYLWALKPILFALARAHAYDLMLHIFF